MTSVSYSTQFLACDQNNCLSCQLGKGHGPYWVARITTEKTAFDIFLGKEFRPMDVSHEITRNIQEQVPQTKANAENRWNLSPDDQNEFLIHAFETPANTSKPTPPDKPVHPPSRNDFNNDLNQLGQPRQLNTLKITYRQLIKKYHPDRFPNYPECNTWMAEINGKYDHYRNILMALR